jgi:translation elongation factor EF-G
MNLSIWNYWRYWFLDEFIPAVDKGAKEAMNKGILAGYPSSM